MAAPHRFASVLEALESPEQEGVLLVDAAFRGRYGDSIAWMLDRLAKSTAGVRGIIAADFGKAAPTLESAEASPQLNLAVVALIAQAYADYFRELPTERRAAFIGFDGRYFSREFAHLFARIFAG